MTEGQIINSGKLIIFSKIATRVSLLSSQKSSSEIKISSTVENILVFPWLKASTAQMCPFSAKSFVFSVEKSNKLLVVHNTHPQVIALSMGKSWKTTVINVLSEVIYMNNTTVCFLFLQNHP